MALGTDQASAHAARLEPLTKYAACRLKITNGAISKLKEMFDRHSESYLHNPVMHPERRKEIWHELTSRPAELEGALLTALLSYRATCPFSGKQERRPELLPSAAVAISVIKNPDLPANTRGLALLTQFFNTKSHEELRALAACLQEVTRPSEKTSAIDTRLLSAFAKQFSIRLSLAS
jgi:hypothetical protein